MWYMYLAHIFTSQRIITYNTLRHKWPGMRILCVCVWCVCVCEHDPMNTQGKQTTCGWFVYTECFATLPCADLPHFSVGSSFENHWRLFNARSPFQRSSLFQRVVIFKSTGCLFQHFPHWQTKFHPTSACTAAQALVQRYNPSCPWVWMEFGFPASGGPDSARPRWCQSHLLSLDKVYLSAPPLYFLKII